MERIGDKLKALREEKGYTREEVATQLKTLGINISAKTIYGYESNRNSTNADMFLALCKIYGCTDIIGTFDNATEDIYYTFTETKMIEKYRNLDDHGKEMVDTVMQKEAERMSKIKLLKPKNTKSLVKYWTPVSAGAGALIDTETDYDIINVVLNIYTKKSDFVLTVRGESMSPRFHDGDLVLVQRAENTEIGEVGIFLIDGLSYIKQKGNNSLISINHDYQNIFVNELSEGRCQGRVIGILDPAWIVENG